MEICVAKRSVLFSSNSRYINVWVTPDIFPHKKPLPFSSVISPFQVRYKSVLPSLIL